MKTAVIQMTSLDNWDENMEKAEAMIDQAANKGADLVALPEYFPIQGRWNDRLKHAENLHGDTVTRLIEKAKTHGVHILGGTILEKSSQGEKAYNTSVLISPKGEILASYRKIHLFDVDIPGKESIRESNYLNPGKEIVTADTSLGTMGLSICYDLRFPELYRALALAGAEIIFVPSAFTLYTGLQHWEALLRARAIENQCYMIAPAQYGTYPPGKMNFGNSMIVDPWGTVVARAPEEETVIYAEIDLKRLKKVRQNMPCFDHRRPELYQ
ncbi:putative amidohydrolase [Melghiribacillus thermohalophilus]|uniref:Putative amidohydrolase n=1 Tax=Melghiribacillus thermohalophilus TaxID=1324956 RepID=A0A4R3MVB8_9BACI|nr:carbon-nitrogen hydrolase family protein [Melghiribacillus thermohalophilus]TCT20470.1 putative amidohydrolase [Melghiribacillus thermohalophilus]